MEAVTQASLLDALRKALEAAPEEDGKAMTTEEIAREMKTTIPTTRERLRVLIAAGKAECVKVKRQRIDGAFQSTAAYRIVG